MSRMLGSLGIGESAVVSSVNGTGPVMMRLMEIGLIPGRSVTLVRRAAFGGPIELLVDQTRVAVRLAEAGCVEIRPASTAAPVTVPSAMSPAPAAV